MDPANIVYYYSPCGFNNFLANQSHGFQRRARLDAARRARGVLALSRTVLARGVVCMVVPGTEMAISQCIVAGVRVVDSLKRQGKGVMTVVAVLKAGIESWVGEHMYITFTSGYGQGFQYVEHNLAF